jgi:hypothetical protein
LQQDQIAHFVFLFVLNVDTAGNVYATSTRSTSTRVVIPTLRFTWPRQRAMAFVVKLDDTDNFDWGGAFGGAGRAVWHGS